MTRRSVASSFVAVVSSGALFAGAAISAVHTYFGNEATMPAYGLSWTPGYNYLNWNRVYRPTGNLFELYYEGGAQYASNSGSNPFWHNQSSGYTRAYCGNLEGHSVNTVTCQYDS